MIALAMDEQIDLFPRASSLDIQVAKKMLEGYSKLRSRIIASDSQGITSCNFISADKLQAGKQRLERIERAVALILDDEIRRIVEFRFLKGNKHKETVLFFSGAMHDSTVDRKIIKGIESVAETLLFMQ